MIVEVLSSEGVADVRVAAGAEEVVCSTAVFCNLAAGVGGVVAAADFACALRVEVSD
jgi:hypothetical protein